MDKFDVFNLGKIGCFRHIERQLTLVTQFAQISWAQNDAVGLFLHADVHSVLIETWLSCIELSDIICHVIFVMGKGCTSSKLSFYVK